MIYAYDEPVQLPVRDLYDTQIMAMAINTAKDMYEKGQLEMKDFAKTYGDFYTPIINDQNWFDLNVTGRLRGALDEIYSLGINPLTNPQARVFLQRIINNMPYGDIAKVRLSADNAREFLKAKQRLWLEGKYNPIYDKYDGPSLSDYATVGDNGLGIWERLSPTPIQDMATFGNPYYEGMKPNIRSESRNGIQYKVESITMDDLKAIADSHFNELVNTPQGQLMYKYYKDLYGGDSNPNSGQQAREAFNSAVAEGQKRRTYTNSDYEDNYYKAQQLAQGWAKIRQDQEKFDWQKFTDTVQLQGLYNPENGGTDASYTTQMEADSISTYNKQAGINSPADYARTTFDIYRYWENKANTETDKKKKKYAERTRDYWLRINKDGLRKAELNGVLVRDKNTKELIPSKVYSRQIGLTYGAPSTGKTSVKKAREQADIYYNKFLTTSGGDEYDKASADFLAGGSGKTSSFPGGSATNKYRVVSFADKDIYFTPMRRLLVAGYAANPNDAPIISAFNEWLKNSHRIGYMVNDNTSRASLPTVTGGRTREISGYARIPYSEFSQFINKYKQEHTDVSTQTICNELGLAMYKMQSSTPINGKKAWVDADVVEIPITRVRVNYNSFGDSKWNTHYDKLTGGQSAAEKKIKTRQIESLNKR